MAEKLSIKSCFEILNVPPDAGFRDLKKAFRRRVRECHPDLNPDRPTAEADLKRVVHAYRMLTSDRYRRQCERMDQAFYWSGHSPSTGDPRFDPLLPDEYRAVVSHPLAGALLGLGAGIAWVVTSGSVELLDDGPATGWCVAAFAAVGGLLAALLHSGVHRSYHLGSFGWTTALGALSGALTGISFSNLLFALGLEPVRAWMLLASAAFGALAGLTRGVAVAGTTDLTPYDPALPALHSPASSLAVIGFGLTVFAGLHGVLLALFGVWYAGWSLVASL